MSGTGVKKDAFANSGTAQGLQQQYAGNAQGVYNTLAPALTNEAIHPQGYSPVAKAAMNTAAQQSAGGSQAATVGQGGLYAARTKNAGGAKAAIGQGTRSAGENLSNAAVGTEVSNANLQAKQQQAGLSGLEGLNSTETSAGLQSLGLSNQALGVANNAKPSFWSQFGQQFAGDALKGLAGA